LIFLKKETGSVEIEYQAQGESQNASVGLGFNRSLAVIDKSDPDYNQYRVIPFHDHKQVTKTGTDANPVNSLTLTNRVGGTDVVVRVDGAVLPESSRLDLRLMSWGDGSGVPTSGNNLVIVGLDNKGLLHIRIFDAGGNRVTDTDETKLPGTQAQAVSNLKGQFPDLLSPHLLTDAEKAQLISEATAIVGQPLSSGSRTNYTLDKTNNVITFTTPQVGAVSAVYQVQGGLLDDVLGSITLSPNGII